MVVEGFLYTGVMGYVDASGNYLLIVDRLEERIEETAPAELEVLT